MTTTHQRPNIRPNNPCFSSGPCAKRPGWSAQVLASALVGRSHRSKPGKARLKEVIDRTRALLKVPADYRIGVVPASDTGAVEMAMWSLLGARGTDILVWESFGEGWASDALKQLKLADARVLKAGYGALPDLGSVDFSRDVVFTWNGTTSGVAVPNGDWIPADREGLTICDATSAVLAWALPWDKLDVTTYSWQKVMGGEGQHGMLVLSPRAAERLESYTPPWPLPKIFRMTKSGKLIEGIFAGETINTPSMLAVEDALDALKWAEALGGLEAMVARAKANVDAIADWVARTEWIDFLAAEPAIRSRTSVCLKLAHPGLDDAAQGTVAKRIAALLDGEGAAFDIGAYRDAPAGLRIWAGATVETADLEALFPWLDWAFAIALAEHQAKATTAA